MLEYETFSARQDHASAILLGLLSENNIHEAYSLAQSRGREEEVYEYLFAIPPSSRHDIHLEIMIKCLHSFDWFHDMPLNVIQELCKISTLERFCKKDLVFKEGEEGHTIYIVLDGHVEVFMEEHHLKQSARRRDSLQRLVAIDLWRKQKQDSQEVYGQKIATLGPGQVFGERAFLMDNRPDSKGHVKTISDGRFKKRGATVVCNSDVKLVTFNGEDFIAIMEKSSADFFEARYNFLRSQPLFNVWNDEDLQALARLCQIQNIGRGTTILEQGRTVSELCIIRRGICKVIMFVKKEKLVAHIRPRDTINEERLLQAYQHQQQRVGDWVRGEAIAKRRSERSYHERFSRGMNGRFQVAVSGMRTPDAEKVARLSRFETNPDYVSMEVALLNSRDVFGEMAVLDSRGLSRIAVVAESQVELLTLKRNDVMAFDAGLSPAFTKLLQKSFVLRNPLEEAVIHYEKERQLFGLYKGKILEKLPQQTHGLPVTTDSSLKLKKVPKQTHGLPATNGSSSKLKKASHKLEAYPLKHRHA